jgi:hypothetical protein
MDIDSPEVVMSQPDDDQQYFILSHQGGQIYHLRMILYKMAEVGIV